MMSRSNPTVTATAKAPTPVDFSGMRGLRRIRGEVCGSPPVTGSDVSQDRTLPSDPLGFLGVTVTERLGHHR